MPRLTTAGFEGAVMLWDGVTGELVHTLQIDRGHVNTVSVVVTHGDEVGGIIVPSS
jgi:ribosomal protein S1